MKFLVLALCIVGASCDLIPFSTDQTNKIRESWNQIKNNGVDILYYIFKENPDIQDKFPQFAGKDLDSIKDTSDFSKHASNVIRFFSELIPIIEGKPNVASSKFLIDNLAGTHKARGVTKDQFNKFRASLTNYIEDNVPLGKNVSAVWQKALDGVYSYLYLALDGNSFKLW
ncbi:unnamed protein product [Chironomus riparius]|uniref:Globin domain-containing protein n=1 Tax=Chironomus riparius TaxID=315576 RepID=A0A9N9RMU9_9DIPT|nr:unnamed protein product [Chironomus riparius]